MPSPTAPSPSLLLSQLRDDQSLRWQAGEVVCVEHYLERYPDLYSDVDALLELILAEALLREERGDVPSLDEYVARFPSHAEQLRQRWSFFRLIRPPERDTNGTVSHPRTAPDSGSLGRLPDLPGFTVLEKLGEGGMGVVYRARQAGLERDVAVKLIRSGALAGDEELARFRTEAKAVARLKHTGVVQVHDLGEHDGHLYLVMEYLPGGSLSARLKRGVLPPREAVGLVRDLARAVQAAHEAKVLHRDLKPGNVLLDGAGGAKVSDFGLARLMDADSGMTRSEAVLGTPAYMSPEQVRGKMAEVGPLSDVWALGIILYECLAGQPPFKGETRSRTLDLVQTAEPAPLRGLRRDVPADLEAVCLKCLEKGPSRRYASAAGLADDLDRWLCGRPLAARPPSRPSRLWRWLGQHRWVGAMVATASGLLLAVAVLMGLDPDRPLRRIEGELANGKEVTLIGQPSGGPPNSLPTPGWFRWALGAATMTGSQPDGAFMIETWTFSLLELLRDPRSSRYRFRARIRHDGGKEQSEVGLVVGRFDFPIGNETGQGFLLVTFNDFQEGPPPGKAPPARHVFLRCAYDTTGGVRRGGLIRAIYFAEPAFPPSPPGRPRWRSVSVEVSPTRVRVFSEKTLVGEVETQEILRRATGVWDRVAPGRADLAGLPSPFRYKPRGGLGLFVADAMASFQDVVVEPLTD